MAVYNVEQFGACADGNTLCTRAVQEAIDACAAAGGGTVRFCAGSYVLGTVFMRSGVTVEICKDATVLGASDFYVYAPHEDVPYPIYQDASHTYFHCSLFVGIDCRNIRLTGGGKIDMRSVWDEDDVRKIVHRGPKCIALKCCEGVEIDDLYIRNATDLAIYFAGCENVDVHHLKLCVYIDGISPDNCKNVKIHDCDVDTGDDGIALKSSYTLGRLGVCENIHIYDCRIKSRCNAVKFGTESNGGFYNVLMERLHIRQTRISGIAIESVDGAVIDGITVRDVTMENVNAPLFVHVGKRMRGPAGREIGKIQNVTLKNITATGPYVPYACMPWNYKTYKQNDAWQKPWEFGTAENFDDTCECNTPESNWQMTSNICGLKESPLHNITCDNVKLRLNGGGCKTDKAVPEEANDYPEVYVYGRTLPAKGIYFRHIDGLQIKNCKVETYYPDTRDDFVFEKVNGLSYGS